MTRTENADFLAVLNRQLTSIGQTAYPVLADLGGNGFINHIDAGMSRDLLNRSLPVGDLRGSSTNPGSVVGVIVIRQVKTSHQSAH